MGLNAQVVDKWSSQRFGFGVIEARGVCLRSYIAVFVVKERAMKAVLAKTQSKVVCNTT